MAAAIYEDFLKAKLDHRPTDDQATLLNKVQNTFINMKVEYLSLRLLFNRKLYHMLLEVCDTMPALSSGKNYAKRCRVFSGAVS